MNEDRSWSSESLSIAISKEESIVIQSGLALAQKALQLETEGNLVKAADFFRKSAIILESEMVINDSGEMHVILQSLVQSYSNKREKLLQQSRVQDHNDIMQTFDSFDVMDPYSVYPSRTSEQDVDDDDLIAYYPINKIQECAQSNEKQDKQRIKESNLKDHIDQVEDQSSENIMKQENIFTSINSNDNGNKLFLGSLEDLLNVAEEQEKIQASVSLLLRSIHEGIQMSHRLYVTPQVWLMGLEESEVRKERTSILSDLENRIQQIIVLHKYSPDYELFSSIRHLAEHCRTLFVSRQDLLVLVTVDSSSDALNKYKDQLFRQFRKMYKNEQDDKPMDYCHSLFDLLRSIILLFRLLNATSTHSQPVGGIKNSLSIQFRKFEKDKHFLFLFVREFILKIVLQDLQAKFNLYIIHAKKKI